MSGGPTGVVEAQAHAAEARRRRGASANATAAATEAPMERHYSGLVTRTLAFALDAAIVNACALGVALVVGLGLSVLHLPENADVLIAAIAGGLWIAWTVGYFAFFWCTTGQTPGDRVMSIRVVDTRGRDRVKPRVAVLRFGGLILAAIPLLAGLLMMLWDDRRRCLQDRLAHTVVIDAPSSGDDGPAGPPAVAMR
jgi:uncharacterized RDD family membrane protein YckC